MRLGCKQIMVFLGCKSLSSRIAFILRSTFFSFILSLLLAFQYLQHFVSLSFNNNTHSAFILEFFAFFFFILAAFTCFFFILLSVLLFVLPYLLSPNNLPPNLGQICFEPQCYPITQDKVDGDIISQSQGSAQSINTRST